MGLLGLIGNAGFSTDTFWWIAVIVGISGILLLLAIIFGDGEIFFTKIIYGFMVLVCAVVTVGAIKGYVIQKQVDELLGQGGIGTYISQPTYQPMTQMPQYQFQYGPMR